MDDVTVFVEDRIKKIQSVMNRNHLDAVVVARPENVFYFSNFNPIINSHPAYVLIPAMKEACLLVHCIRHDHACQEGAISNVQLYGKWGANAALAMNPIDALAILLGKQEMRLGIEGDYASVNWVEELQSKVSVKDLKDVSGDIAMLKTVKDAYEINCLRKAATLVDCGVEATIKSLEQGANEAEACTEGQFQMRKMWHRCFQEYEVCGFGSSEGAQIDSLVVWSMANERIAYGCDCPKDYTPVVGDLVLPMAWARIGGYAAEIERTVAVGDLNDLKSHAYDSMLQARQAVFDRVKPGVLFESLYAAAMNVYEEAGFGDILPGRCGHGIGLSTHEFPSVAKNNKIPLQSGMVFTVEPGLMTKEWGGVRHSDTILVTETGYELLTKFRNDRIVIRK